MYRIKLINQDSKPVEKEYKLVLKKENKTFSYKRIEGIKIINVPATGTFLN